MWTFFPILKTAMQKAMRPLFLKTLTMPPEAPTLYTSLADVWTAMGRAFGLEEGAMRRAADVGKSPTTRKVDEAKTNLGVAESVGLASQASEAGQDGLGCGWYRCIVFNRATNVQMLQCSLCRKVKWSFNFS